jgi:short-subunit dehydrogenase
MLASRRPVSRPADRIGSNRFASAGVHVRPGADTLSTMTYPFSSALVTGASSGIGEAMARRLGEAAIPTVLVARRGDRLQVIADRYRGFEVLVADLATPAGQAAVAERIASPSQPIDLVVNNAGFGSSGNFNELAADRLAEEIEVNVAALTKLSHAALEVMVPRGRGWLLNVSSIASFQAAPRLAVYAATKAYVTSLSESLHEEVSASGVKVTVLCPGLTRTEFQQVSNTTSYVDQFPGFVWSGVDEVARVGLESSAKGRAIAVPGLLYKGVVTVSGFVPRGLSRRISGLVQRG